MNEEQNLGEVHMHTLKTKDALINVQKAMDKRNNDFIDSLPDNEKAKFDAVKKALDILGEAGVNSLLFPILPSYDKYHKIDDNAPFLDKLIRDNMYQYNNSSYFMQYDDEGNYTTKSKVQISLFHHQFLLSFMYYLRTTIFHPDLPHELHLPNLIKLLNSAHDWHFKNILPKEVEELLKEHPIDD
jgi:hypothetical protein